MLSLVAGAIILAQPAAAARAQVSAAVHWSDGPPAAGVLMQMTCHGRSGRTIFDAHGTLLADGRFEFRGVPAAGCELSATWVLGFIDLSHETKTSATIEVKPGARLQIDLPPLPRKRVEGTVRDPEGHPVPGALIAMCGCDLGGTDVTRAGPDGRYTFYLPVWYREIWAGGKGFVYSRTDVVESGVGPLDLSVDLGVSIHGTVVTLDGSPVEGATVGVERDDRSDSQHGGVLLGGRGTWSGPVYAHWSLEQEAHGAFTLRIPTDDVVLASYKLSATSPDHGKGNAQVMPPVVSGKAVVIKIGTPIIRGRLVDERGRPRSGARVQRAYACGPGEPKFATTDRDGAFSFNGCGLGRKEDLIFSDAHRRRLGSARVDIPEGASSVDAGVLHLSPPALTRAKTTK